MKNQLFLIAPVLFLFMLCAMNKKNELTKAAWLIGTWENETSKGSIYEVWNKTSDIEFSGKSYMLSGKDTIVFETIRLVQEADGLAYIPTVKNQNENLPVRFLSTSISEDEIIFENPQHDFPQIISYTKINADSLVAKISGMRNGVAHEKLFPMNRLK